MSKHPDWDYEFCDQFPDDGDRAYEAYVDRCMAMGEDFYLWDNPLPADALGVASSDYIDIDGEDIPF